QRTHVAGPHLRRHLAAIGREPGDVLDRAFANALPLKEAAAVQDRWTAAHLDDVFRKAEQILLLGRPLPVEPADLVVLAVGVVVTALSAAHLVPGVQHRNAEGKKDSREKVALLTRADGADLRVRRRALDAVVEAVVVVLAVAIAFEVCFVVLLVVADQIVQCETGGTR